MLNRGDNEHLGLANRTETNIEVDWTKSFVEREIPDEATLRREGIELDLPTARLVATSWSRILWHGDARKRNTPYNAWCLIERVVAAQVPTSDGNYLPSLLTVDSHPTVPSGEAALRRAGVDSAAISRLRDASPTFATSCAPLRLLLFFLPPPAWPHVAALIGSNPNRDLRPRVDEALREHGTSVGNDRLEAVVAALWVLFSHLCELHRELAAEHAHRETESLSPLVISDAITRWTHRPPQPTKADLQVYGQGGSRQDRSAIPLPTLVTALKLLVREAAWGKWPPEAWPFNRSWRAVKRLAILCVLLTGCPRITHLLLLDVDDFAPVHVFEDGSTGPGLRFRRVLMKNGRQSKDVYWKRLPDLVGEVLVAWIICSGRTIGQPDAPLFITKKLENPGEPGARYASDSSIRPLIAGTSKGENIPLIPLPGEPRRGYAPHRYRNTMLQLVERLFAGWKTLHPGHHLAAYAPHDVAEIAIDHKVNDLGYRDYKSRKRLEELLGLEIELVWAELWGDGLQTRGLDPDAITRAHDALCLIEAELELLDQQVAELEAVDVSALRRSRGAESESEKLDALVASQAARGEIGQKLRRQMKLKDDLLAANTALNHALSVPVLLPDDLDCDAHSRKLGDALARVEGKDEPVVELVAAVPKSAELTTGDIADLFNCTPTHVRRWRQGKSNPPIDPVHWIRYNEKDWRYPVAAIDARTLARIPAEDPIALLDAICRARATLGFGKGKAVNYLHAEAQAVPSPSDDQTERAASRGRESAAHELQLTEGLKEPSDSSAPRRGARTGLTAELRALFRRDSDRLWTRSELINELTRSDPLITADQRRNSINAPLVRLTKAGEIERIGRGKYRALQLGSPPTHVITAEVRVVMRNGLRDQLWTNADLFDELAPAHPDVDSDRLQRNITQALHSLTNAGELERRGQGRYRVVELTNRRIDGIIIKLRPPLNGHGPSSIAPPEVDAA